MGKQVINKMSKEVKHVQIDYYKSIKDHFSMENKTIPYKLFIIDVLLSHSALIGLISM